MTAAIYALIISVFGGSAFVDLACSCLGGAFTAAVEAERSRKFNRSQETHDCVTLAANFPKNGVLGATNAGWRQRVMQECYDGRRKRFDRAGFEPRNEFTHYIDYLFHWKAIYAGHADPLPALGGELEWSGRSTLRRAIWSEASVAAAEPFGQEGLRKRGLKCARDAYVAQSPDLFRTCMEVRSECLYRVTRFAIFPAKAERRCKHSVRLTKAVLEERARLCAGPAGEVLDGCDKVRSDRER